MVFFKREALDDFCSAMLDVTQMPQQEQWQAFKAGQYLIEQVGPGGNLLCWFYVLCWFETFGVVFALNVAVMQCRLGSCLGPVQGAKHGMACGIVAWRSQCTGQGMCVKNALPQSRCARGLYVWQLLLLMLPLLRLLACLAVSSCSLVSPLSLQDEWTDMPYLAAFSRFIRPDLSHTILCGTPSSINRPLCPRLQYMLGVGASFIPISENPPSVDNNCSRLAEFVEWRDAGGSSAARGDGSNSTRLLRSLLTNSAQAGGTNPSNMQHQQLPQLWTRWRYYPSKRGEGERAPLIHFQGECKHAGVQQVRRLFVESGLVPDLEAVA